MMDKFVNFETVTAGNELPLVVSPKNANLSLLNWAADNRDWIKTGLSVHGAILFRGFADSHLDGFEKFTAIVSDRVMDYRERSSPRHTVKNNIYTSTDYPPSQKIFPHNEHSYSKTFPQKLFFYCSIPPNSGGETPIADCRRILRRLSPETVNKFRDKKWMYVRNFGDGFGLPWETVFQTDDKNTVENYCRQNLIQFEWKPDNHLKTRQIRPVVIDHPVTGEEIWFNHLTFFNVATLDPNIREIMLEAFPEEDLPNNTYYGDGTKIEDHVLEELQSAYLNELVTFKWQQNDIILLDNILTAHARNEFTKPREILFSMADPFTRNDL
ncbi:TauD/TfdA family dioxygenase [Planktothrix sp. FACHB-1355]|uniref:TauD/TfdA family dioxygenase n=1 Tax=Planktothrix sp. FACHB-1355 TaxID=2692854 RepID=UPI00168B73C4|nr:TauD/TfdA family dioxygenase [Planktothrix sp. FACHB-1355]MBD3557334.1 TauD/TfdA family dioxygenase [Planktothrix sp. FACHB-1355]